MVIDAELLSNRRIPLANIERWARWLGVFAPDPRGSDYARRRELVARILLRLRESARVAVGAASVVAAAVALGVL